MKRIRIISAGLLLAAALWIVRPAAESLYRGFVEGRASGALLFSIVQAVGQHAAQSHTL